VPGHGRGEIGLDQFAGEPVRRQRFTYLTGMAAEIEGALEVALHVAKALEQQSCGMADQKVDLAEPGCGTVASLADESTVEDVGPVQVCSPAAGRRAVAPGRDAQSIAPASTAPRDAITYRPT
jgi:hypothetical protein